MGTGIYAPGIPAPSSLAHLINNHVDNFPIRAERSDKVDLSRRDDSLRSPPDQSTPLPRLGTQLRRYAQDHGLALLLGGQGIAALLLGTAVLPLPHRLTTGPAWLPLVDVCGFAALCAATAYALFSLHRQRTVERGMLHSAYHDSGTDLPNHAAMEQMLEVWLEAREPVSCFLLQLCGDPALPVDISPELDLMLMQSMATQLKPVIRGGDVLAKLGGDRFAILLRGAHTRQALSAFADRLLVLLTSSDVVSSGPGRVNIGVASAPTDATDGRTLLAVATSAMTLACSAERHGFCFADTLLHDKGYRARLLHAKLRLAVGSGSLHLVYQPIFSRDGRMVAAEALTRWHDIEEGNISPGEFIPAAESSGLIFALSNWVLRSACSQMAEWSALGCYLQRIAVNVSVKQASREDFVATVVQTLQETSLAPALLELEVTESALSSDFDAVNRNLQSLRSLGVRVSIDDFGTGYSSLGRVRELAADVLKIDRVFIQGIGVSADSEALVQTIINMAHTLHLVVVAEGVETQEQMKILHGMACDEIQGFLLAKPQTAEALTAEMQQAATPPPQTTHRRMVPRIA